MAASDPWPGCTVRELEKFLTAQFGQIGRGWLLCDGNILVYGDQDGAAERRWWKWGEVKTYCRSDKR